MRQWERRIKRVGGGARGGSEKDVFGWREWQGPAGTMCRGAFAKRPLAPPVALTATSPRRPPVCLVASPLSPGDPNGPLPPRPHHPTN